MELSKVINGGKEIIFVKGILHHLKGNAKPYFAITGSIWKYNGKTKVGSDPMVSGCIHDEILKAFPDLQDFVSLHLSGIDGVPMHSVENGWYYLDTIGDKFTIDTIKKHLRISTEEAQMVIDTMNTKEEFKAYVDSQRERWLSEANAVIVRYDLKVVHG